MKSLRPASRSVHRTLLAALLALPVAAQATTTWIASSTEKIRPGTASRALVAPALTAARNEFEAFQIAVVGPVANVSVTATALSNGTRTIPAPRFFREALIDVGTPSGPDGATGAFPDALVPDVDDVVGEKRNAFPFDVPASETRAVFAEVHVPLDAAAGAYTGSVVVHASGGDVAIPLTLTVYDFALPSTSSLKSFFAMYYGDLIAAHGSAATAGDAHSTLRARYAQLGLDHRISVSNFDDGNSNLDHFTSFYGPLIDGNAPTQLAGARITLDRLHRRALGLGLRELGELLQGQELVRLPLRLHLRRAHLAAGERLVELPLGLGHREHRHPHRLRAHRHREAGRPGLPHPRHVQRAGRADARVEDSTSWSRS